MIGMGRKRWNKGIMEAGRCSECSLEELACLDE